jgi:hypothetical protein
MAEFATAKWIKSSQSDQNGACVEIAFDANHTGIRDSKNPHGGHLTTRTVAFGQLVAAIKTGTLDPR